MSNQRLHAIQEWADKAVNLDQTANTAIALGVALAHINELAAALTAANMKTAQLQVELNLKAMKTEPNPFIFTPPNPLTPNPLDASTRRNPFIMTYGGSISSEDQANLRATVEQMTKDYKEEITFPDTNTIPVVDGNAEFKTEFYGSQTYNNPQVTTALEKDLGAALVQAARNAASRLKSLEENLQDALNESLNTPVDVDAIVDNHCAVENAISLNQKSSDLLSKNELLQELLENDSWSINSVKNVCAQLDDDENRRVANCDNIEQKYDEELFTKPATLKSLLDKHFQKADTIGEPFFVAQINTPVIDELTVCNEEESKQIRSRNNLPIKQQLGIDEFTGTVADLPNAIPKNISWADRKLREQGIAIPSNDDEESEVSKTANVYRVNPEAHNELIQQLVELDAKTATQVAADAFIDKYGGEIAVIDTPFEGLAMLAPGMDEDGHIEDGTTNYIQEQILAHKLRDQE